MQHLKQAIAIHRSSLDGRDPDRNPVYWARDQIGLADALCELAAQTKDPDAYQQAVAAYDAVLSRQPFPGVDCYPAAIQGRLGRALIALGRLRNAPTHLERAVAVSRDAKSAYSPDSPAMAWAGANRLLGDALLALAEARSQASPAKEALAVWREAFEVYMRAGAAQEVETLNRDMTRAKQLVTRPASPAGG